MRAGLRRGLRAAPIALLVALALVKAAEDEPAATPTPLLLTVGLSAVVDTDLPIERISTGFGDMAKATPIGPRQLLVNAKNPGVTSLIVWQEGKPAYFPYYGGGKSFPDG